jgi:phosphoglycolate phosphatase
MFKNIKAAIIDLDGTMLDTAPDFEAAVNLMRNDLGLAPLSRETIINCVGKGTENLIRTVLAIDYDETGVTKHFAQALASYMQHYHRINGDLAMLYPEVNEGLQQMRNNGLRLACVTNKPLALAVPLLEKKGLHAHFDIVYGGDSFPQKKPSPVPMLQVCKAFSLLPEQVIAIGDSSNDAIAARAAGCKVLTVPYGYNHGESVHNIDSDGIVQTLLEAANKIV